MVTTTATSTTPGTDDDPFEDAANAEWNPVYTVYGQVTIDAWYCALVKGAGKVRFDASVHNADQRNTAVEIRIVPVLPGQRDTVRSMIAESAEWAKIVKPSIIAVGLRNPRELQGYYVEAQLVPSGRKYTGTDQMERDATTIKFARLFAGEDECVAAAEAARGHRRKSSAASQVATNGATTPAPVQTSSDAERLTVAKFLPALWKAANSDVTTFAELLAKNPLTHRHFDLSSPEVLAVIQPADDKLPS